ncbi:MAG TPA: ATP-binding protein [Streptosporangiaceae bacterium]|jgi:anti-sigma regulatory factor (Ser/Thr protein kinase)
MTAPDPADLRWIRVEEPSAASGCRGTALGMAERLGFGQARAEELAVAVTEAASNLAKHARAGAMMLRADRGSAVPGIELVTVDAGPGIADVPAAARDGTSTAGTLGIGLGAIRRAADFCTVFSLPGRGTALAARFLAHRGDPGLGGWAGLIRPIGDEVECGDNYIARRTDRGVTAMLCDGLGHGPLAATASRESVAVLREAPDEEPVALLRRVHARLARTRGGAVAIAAVEPPTVTFAGLGNVAGWILSGPERQGMISVPGIAGHQARTFRQYSYPLPPGSAVILHSDGLSSRWSAAGLPGLAGQDPLVIAATLLREAGGHRDDAGILVLRP